MGVKFRNFFSKPEYSKQKLHQMTKGDTFIPKYFLEMDIFSWKWVLIRQISFLEMGASWISSAAHPSPGATDLCLQVRHDEKLPD